MNISGGGLRWGGGLYRDPTANKMIDTTENITFPNFFGGR